MECQTPSPKAYDDKLWVIGGTGGSGNKDVWYSTDGISWIKATSNGGQGYRYGHCSVVHDNKMWIIGGVMYSSDRFFKSDVWNSTDGNSWTEATSDAGFTGRAFFGCTIHNSEIRVLGGYYKSNSTWSFSDNFKSTDGLTWTKVASKGSWSSYGSYFHKALSYNSKLWILPGGRGTGTDNVYYLFK